MAGRVQREHRGRGAGRRAGIWGTLALAIAGPPEPLLRNALAGAFGLATLAALTALVLGRWRRNALLTHFALFAAVLAWFLSLQPSNDRNWQTNVAVLPHATIEADLVTVTTSATSPTAARTTTRRPMTTSAST